MAEEMIFEELGQDVASRFGLRLLPGHDMINQTKAIMAFEVIKSATELIFPALASTMMFSGNEFTLALIRKELGLITKKLDTLLDVNNKSAKDLLALAIIHLENEEYEKAFNGFQEVLTKAIDAYNCIQEDDLKFIKASETKMFCHIMVNAYDQNLKLFIPFLSLGEQKKKHVNSLIKNEVSCLLKDVKTIRKSQKGIQCFKKTDKLKDIMQELFNCLGTASNYVDFETVWTENKKELTTLELLSKEFAKSDNLLEATKKGDTETVKALISVKREMISYQDGYDALYWACYKNYEEIVHVLLSANLKPDIPTKDSRLSPLTEASKRGYSSIVRMLIWNKADINCRNNDHGVPLYWACHEGWHLIVDILLEAKADPNICTKEEKLSPLMIASEKGHVIIVKSLLKNKADINQKDQNGLTALDRANKAEKMEIVEILQNYVDAMEKEKKENDNLYPTDLPNENGVSFDISEEVVNTKRKLFRQPNKQIPIAKVPPKQVSKEAVLSEEIQGPKVPSGKAPFGLVKCNVYNNTNKDQEVNSFNYSDGVRLVPQTKKTILPDQTHEFFAFYDFRGLIITTGIFDKGQHYKAKNGQLVLLSDVLKAEGNIWVRPWTGTVEEIRDVFSGKAMISESKQ